MIFQNRIVLKSDGHPTSYVSDSPAIVTATYRLRVINLGEDFRTRGASIVPKEPYHNFSGFGLWSVMAVKYKG